MATKNPQLTIPQIVNDPDLALSMEPEELARFVLQDLIQADARRESINRHNYGIRFQRNGEDVQKAIIEAWMWLEREGCLAPSPGAVTGNSMFVTRRGNRLAESPDTSSYKRSALLPKEFLHPVIAQKVWSAFIRGEFDTAVFQAFKQVEVYVRNAGSFPNSVLGVKLMRKAFNPNEGPLADKDAELAEQQALSDLFAGAIGSYKNPHSHRNISVNDPDEAAEMIILASHLLKIVDVRSTHQST